MSTAWLPAACMAVQRAIVGASRGFKEMGLPPALAPTTDAATLQALRVGAQETLAKAKATNETHARLPDGWGWMGWMGGWIDGWMDRWVDEWMGG